MINTILLTVLSLQFNLVQYNQIETFHTEGVLPHFMGTLDIRNYIYYSFHKLRTLDFREDVLIS